MVNIMLELGNVSTETKAFGATESLTGQIDFPAEEANYGTCDGIVLYDSYSDDRTDCP